MLEGCCLCAVTHKPSSRSRPASGCELWAGCLHSLPPRCAFTSALFSNMHTMSSSSGLQTFELSRFPCMQSAKASLWP